MNQKKPDKEQVKQMRKLMAEGGDNAVKRRYGTDAEGTDEYAEAAKKRRHGRGRSISAHG